MNLPKNELINYLNEVIALEAECFVINATIDYLKSNRLPMIDVPDATLQPPSPPKRPPNPPTPKKKHHEPNFSKELKSTFSEFPDQWVILLGVALLLLSLFIVFGFDTRFGGNPDTVVFFCFMFVLAGYSIVVLGAVIYTAVVSDLTNKHMEERNEAQYRRACREYDAKIKQNQEIYSRQCQDLMKDHEMKKQTISDRRNECIVQNQISWRINGMIDQSMEQLKNNKDALTDILNKIYDVDVIYPKYRHLVAVSSFHEYLESGRCEELEGTNGAYNIYEAESRTDHIIRKLDVMITKLDEIKDHIAAVQHKLYKELVRVNENIEDLQNLVHFGIESVKSEMKAQTWHVKDLTHGVENLGGNLDKSFSQIDDYLLKLDRASDRALLYLERHKWRH